MKHSAYPSSPSIQTHRRLAAVFFYLAILISTMVSLPIMVSPRPALADANPGLRRLQPAAEVACGMLYSVFLDYDGLVYVWGDNTYSQIGDQAADHSSTMVQLELPEPARDICAGACHTLILGQSGTVYALGRNAYGQVGDGTVTNVSYPVALAGLPPIRAVAAGDYHSLALGEDGSVWAWGHNSSGQVGDVPSEEVTGLDGQILARRNTRPVCILQSGAVAIAAGGNFSLCIDQQGQVLAWGDNSCGQLGDGTTESHARPAPVPGLTQVVDLAAGSNHVLALSVASGYRQLYVWGDNSLGQLGLGSPKAAQTRILQPQLLDLTGNLDASDERLLSVAAGYTQSAAVRDVSTARFGRPKLKNELYVWGLNTSHQLGLTDPASRYRPVRLRETAAGGLDLSAVPLESLAFGANHLLVLGSNGLLTAAGANERGQLGLGDEDNRSLLTPVATRDLIRPRWIAGQSLKLSFKQDHTLRIRWPSARDNRSVAGYLVELTVAGHAPEVRDAGLTTHYEISGLDPDVPIQVRVFAYDTECQEANRSELASLTAFSLPEGAQAGTYFLTLAPRTDPVDPVRHNWQADPTQGFSAVEVDAESQIEAG